MGLFGVIGKMAGSKVVEKVEKTENRKEKPAKSHSERTEAPKNRKEKSIKQKHTAIYHSTLVSPIHLPKNTRWSGFTSIP